MDHSEINREELYRLVWSEPVRTVAARYEMSDVGLVKVCKRFDIPTPPRGYWAKKQARKQTPDPIPLPPRGLGMPVRFAVVGGQDRYHYWTATKAST